MTRATLTRVLASRYGFNSGAVPMNALLPAFLQTVAAVVQGQGVSFTTIHTISHHGRHLSYSFLGEPTSLGQRMEVAHYSLVFDRVYFWDRWYGAAMMDDAVQVGTVKLDYQEIPVMQINR